MDVLSVKLPTSAATLYSLTGTRRAARAIFQSPAANTGIAYLGNSSAQPFEFAASGVTIELPNVDFETTYVKGTSGDYITILAF